MLAKAQRVISQAVERQLPLYAGKWITFTTEAVVGVGDTPGEALAQARNAGVAVATLFRVPSREDADTRYY